MKIPVEYWEEVKEMRFHPFWAKNVIPWNFIHEKTSVTTFRIVPMNYKKFSRLVEEGDKRYLIYILT